jgi:hypothetical protein
MDCGNERTAMNNTQYKFRAWDKTSKAWVYSDTIPGSMAWFWDIIDDCGYPVMQYAGIKDRNGKEIYESDIVCNWRGDTGSVVEIFHGSFSHKRDNMRFFLHPGIIVIGNIYENPELIKEDEPHGQTDTERKDPGCA